MFPELGENTPFFVVGNAAGQLKITGIENRFELSS
jgi:hypothetical protein